MGKTEMMQRAVLQATIAFLSMGSVLVAQGADQSGSSASEVPRVEGVARPEGEQLAIHTADGQEFYRRLLEPIAREFSGKRARGWT